MKIERKTFFRIGISLFLAAVCGYYFISMNLFSVLFTAVRPLLYGAVIAYIINILMSFYERHYFVKKESSKTRRPVCMVAAILTIILVLALVIGLVVPQFISCINTLIQKAPEAIGKLLSIPQIAERIPEDIESKLAEFDWNTAISKVTSVLGSGLTNAAKNVAQTVSTVVSGIIAVALGILFAVYFLFSKDKLKNQFGRMVNSYLSPGRQEKMTYILSVVNESFHKYIVAQCLEAMVLGGLCAIGMLVFRFPYAIMISALVGITALIPVAGGYIGASIGAFMILSVSPQKALLFLVFLVVLQTIESNLIAPKVVGSSVGLPSMWVLAAVTVGGSLSGVMGMLIAVPFASAAYKIIRDNLNKREAASEKSETAD